MNSNFAATREKKERRKTTEVTFYSGTIPLSINGAEKTYNAPLYARRI